jgi:hypothetical protein
VAAPLFTTLEPVPAFGGVGRFGLCRVGNEEALLLCALVHLRACSKVIGRLGTAVQHHHQRQRLASVTARHIQLVSPAAGLVGKVVGFESRACGNNHCRRLRRATGQTLPPACDVELAQTVQKSTGCRRRRRANVSALRRAGCRAGWRHRPGASGRRRGRHHVENGRRPVIRLALDGRFAGGQCSAQHGHRFLQPALARQSQGLHHVDARTYHHGSSPG